ncbi:MULTISPECIES: hypothetical protein [unclassified Streptomyces]|uniref:hypothetical protein n=1 Tax=unclassified Streptomyces TaxID=2593676 RepID=UPI00190868F1|nr:hypothetical protein [Streptomyces sp. HSG2]
MPLSPEEPQIYESAQGSHATSAGGRSASNPRPVPGPRPAAPPRPGRPGQHRPAPPTQRTPRDAAPTPSRPSAPIEGRTAAEPRLQLIPASPESALDAAEEAVDLLLESGYGPGEVLFLTTGEPHPWAAHELSFGEASYWSQHDAGEDVFYADVSAAARAAVRPVVVVALNGGADEVVATAPSSGRARAGALLIVCGDPRHVDATSTTGA